MTIIVYHNHFWDNLSSSKICNRDRPTDHNLVHLLPEYKPLVNRQPAETCTVKAWAEESEEAQLTQLCLKNCVFLMWRTLTV